MTDLKLFTVEITRSVRGTQTMTYEVLAGSEMEIRERFRENDGPDGAFLFKDSYTEVDPSDRWEIPDLVISDPEPVIDRELDAALMASLTGGK